MSTAPVKVTRAGVTRSFTLEQSATLADTRTVLSAPPNPLMQEADQFISGATAIPIGSEGLIPLSALVGSARTLLIGAPVPVGDADLLAYNALTEVAQRQLLEAAGLRRGLTMTADGPAVCTRNLFDWPLHQLPVPADPTVEAQVEHLTARSAALHGLHLRGVHSDTFVLSAALHDDTPDPANPVVFIAQRFISQRVSLSAQGSQLQGDPSFQAALVHLLKDGSTTVEAAKALVGLLNDWGWYVPVQATLGGALSASTSAPASTPAELSRQAQQANAQFKTAILAIGGEEVYNTADSGGSVDTASEEHPSTTLPWLGASSAGALLALRRTQKQLMKRLREATGGSTSPQPSPASLQLVQEGGAPGSLDGSKPNSFDAWDHSLDGSPRRWCVVSYTGFHPSLMLLAGAGPDATAALGTADLLLQRYASYPEVQALQPWLDLAAYELQLATLLNPWR